MYLKRLFEDGKPNKVRVLRASPRWNVSPRLVERGAAEGWLSLVGGFVVLNTEAGELRYRIVAAPTVVDRFYRTELVTEAAA